MSNETGELLRDFGIAQVTENTQEEWRTLYQSRAEEWLRSLVKGTVFLSEDIRTALTPLIGEPHHHNAWSAMSNVMLRRWRKDRKIRDHGSSVSKRAEAHARLVRQYMKAVD